MVLIGLHIPLSLFLFLPSSHCCVGLKLLWSTTLAWWASISSVLAMPISWTANIYWNAPSTSSIIFSLQLVVTISWNDSLLLSSFFESMITFTYQTITIVFIVAGQFGYRWLLFIIPEEQHFVPCSLFSPYLKHHF